MNANFEGKKVSHSSGQSGTKKQTNMNSGAARVPVYEVRVAFVGFSSCVLVETK